MGNLGSIKNMLHRIGCDEVIISRDPSDIEKADKLILPGVGAFDQGIKNLTDFGLFDAIKAAVIGQKTPIMGICLGMQLLGRKSEEGSAEGLALIPFDTVRFKLDENYKIPHMGWSDVEITKRDNMTQNLSDAEQRFYFVHSYHALCDNEADVLMTCEYGYKFAAAVSHDNVFGFQFHPEKSHKYGMELFKNYIKV
jgi:glutamine amidotransferase